MIRIEWTTLKEVWGGGGVKCDRKMPGVELKGRVFKTIIRPAVKYGPECHEEERCRHK